MMRTYVGVVMVLSLLLLGGCWRFTTEDGSDVYLRRGTVGAVAEMAGSGVLRAMVKGSIYESGEFVSVYGTCLDNEDSGWVGSTGRMSAWYPNGTQYLDNVSMSTIQTGYFLYTGNMSVVQGTYLTEFTCHTPQGYVAKAFGEWQNPYWVARIGMINDSLSGISGQLGNLSGQVGNISEQISNLSTNITNSFEITWQNQNNTNVLINNSYYNLTQQLTYVASVANASVDRNDSYLAYLLQLIAASTGAPVNGSLSVNESASDPVVNKMWTIRVNVTNEYGIVVGEPLVSCFINTTNQPPTTNALMSAKRDSSDKPYFTYSEKIFVSSGGPFSWVVRCVYN